MDVFIIRLFLSLFYVSLSIGALIELTSTGPYRIVVQILYVIFAAGMIYHNWHFYKNVGNHTQKKILLYTLLVFASVIQYFDNTDFAGFYFFLLITTALLLYKISFNIPFILIAFSTHILMLYIKTPYFQFLEFWYKYNTILLPRLLIIAIILITSYSLKISKENKQLAESLHKKTVALEASLAELSAYAEELKETADLRAREKLMHELHDKLGHILATASISTQVAVVLLDNDLNAGKLRLNMVAQQLQLAMQSLRDVISGGNSTSNEKETNLTQSLIGLMEETEKRTGFVIRHNLSEEAVQDLDGLSLPKRSFLYNALMEGLTNGLKHGEASKFEFNLECDDHKIHFCLSDNGKGFQHLKLGYGLSKIQQDVKRFEGEFEISGYEGCTLRLVIPR